MKQQERNNFDAKKQTAVKKKNYSVNSEIMRVMLGNRSA